MKDIRNDDIYLIEDVHRYVLKRDPDQVFKSVTTIVGEYFAKFDRVGTAQRLTDTHPKYTHMSSAELMAAWDAKTQIGTDIHNEIDNYFRDNTPPELNRAIVGINWLNFHRGEKVPKNEVLSEVILYSVELGFAGTIDVLLNDLDTDTYEIIDWKTGKLDFESYRGKKAPHSITSDLMDCRFEKYTLQLSMYRYILEKYYSLNISNQIIAHIGENECRGYDAPYYKSHVEAIIADQIN